MTLEKIRQKARDLRAKTRRELLGSIATPVIVIGLSGWGVVLTHEPALRLVFAFAIAWALAGQYFLHRGMWPATLPGDAALSTGLEFYRREVKRRRYVFGRAMQWSFGPTVLSIGAWILTIVMIGNGTNLNPSVKMIPFFTLLVIWLGGVFVLRMRQQRELQREIDELSEMERAN
jgi:Flp pilus assembly protein TadB